MDTRPALWFSRHEPTAEQLADVVARGYTLVALTEGMTLGAVNIVGPKDAEMVYSSLLELASAHGARAVFGVFPTPIQAQLCLRSIELALCGPEALRGGVSCYASWNAKRTPDGGRPTFAHQSWELVGYL